MSVSQKGHENKLAIPSRCSTGVNPRASGESFNVNMMSNPTDSAIIPGAHSPHFLGMKTKSGRKIQAVVGENLRSIQVFWQPCRQVSGQQILPSYGRCSTCPDVRHAHQISNAHELQIVNMLKYPPNTFLVLLQQTKRLKSWHSLERQTLEEYLIRPGTQTM